MDDLCPRCGRVIPPSQETHLSHWDDETPICSRCDWDERVGLHWGSHDSLNPTTGFQPWVNPPK